MRKFFLASLAILIVTMTSTPALLAWEADGVIPGTEIDYSELVVSKDGVSVKLTNTSADDVKVSLRLAFFDDRGNETGYSIFGLREIPAGESAEISGNHLSGRWKSCKDAARINFSRMTYDIIYE
jgi:hypothetical protein